MALVLVAWVAVLAMAAVRGRSVPWFSIGYNLPITLAFGAFATNLVVVAFTLGGRRFLSLHGPVILVWSLGAMVLFLRLVTKSIDVSGHMAWAVLMSVQCVVENMPRWFTAFVWCIAVQILLLKAFVLGGRSGAWGLLAGVVLSVVLAGAVWAKRWVNE
jgi:hypothetical protein